MRQLIWSEMYYVPGCIDRDAIRIIQRRGGRQDSIAAEPGSARPATVYTAPVDALITRTRAEEESVKYKVPERFTASEGL